MDKNLSSFYLKKWDKLTKFFLYMEKKQGIPIFKKKSL